MTHDLPALKLTTGMDVKVLTGRSPNAGQRLRSVGASRTSALNPFSRTSAMSAPINSLTSLPPRPRCRRTAPSLGRSD